MAKIENCLLNDSMSFHGYYHLNPGFAETVNGANLYLEPDEAIKLNQVILSNADLKAKLEQDLQSNSYDPESGRHYVTALLALEDFVSYFKNEVDFKDMMCTLNSWKTLGATEVGVNWFRKPV